MIMVSGVLSEETVKTAFSPLIKGKVESFVGVYFLFNSFFMPGVRTQASIIASITTRMVPTSGYFPTLGGSA